MAVRYELIEARCYGIGKNIEGVGEIKVRCLHFIFTKRAIVDLHIHAYHEPDYIAYFAG